MLPTATVHVGTAHDLVHTSLLLTGFDRLARRGALALRYEVPRGDHAWLTADPMVVCVDLEGPRSLRIAIDLRDGEGVSWPIIDRVARYFKRAFYPPELTRLAPELAAKVEPYGLNFGARSGGSTVRLLAAIGWPLLATGRAGLHRLRAYLATPGMAAFEQDPDVPLEAKVAYQTRLWTEGEVPAGELDGLNADRVAMVRTLRRAFGPRYVGGLIPTPLALARYPEDVTPYPSRYRAYLKIKKRCLVSVYTRGVEQSLAFKLGESIAMAQCLVSVPLKFQPPAPLERGRHYLPFDTTDACVAACQRLMDDPALARDLRHAAAAYYRAEIEPAAHTARVIDRCFA